MMNPIFKAISVFVLVLILASCENAEQNLSSKTESVSSVVSEETKSETEKEETFSKNMSTETPKEESGTVDSHEHEWGKWIHDKFPNSETGELGSSHRTCKICKTVETKELTEEEVHHMFTTDGLIYLQ